jgi:hypothetical protein
MLIDEHLAAFRWRERHAIEVAAPVADVYAATRTVTAAEIPVARQLTWVRSLPGRALGRRAPPPATTQPVLDDILRSGFVLLGEEPGREIVVGIVGRFWQACPVHATLDEPSAFGGFDEPGWAKAAMNFTVEPLDGGRTRLATETRIAATDPASARRFALYWALVRPGSGLIRRAWLRAVAKRATRGSRAGGPR